jgi:uncharacterized PurR-regulated membrane protein YhhQ (DUF165 family)
MQAVMLERRVWPGVLAMIGIVVASNVLVQLPINDWLTYGAFVYPIAFLVTDLTNRSFGPRQARAVAWAGFLIAVLLSAWLAGLRIAIGSGTAFMVAQLLDILIFDRLRRQSWWRAPLLSSSLASAVDTVLFFAIAFAGTGLPWVTWAAGDFGIKLLMALVLLGPFRVASGLLPVTEPTG